MNEDQVMPSSSPVVSCWQQEHCFLHLNLFSKYSFYKEVKNLNFAS